MTNEKPPLPRAFWDRREIGRRLKLTREALDLKPVDICKMIGINANTYSQWESGANRINLDDGVRYVQVLNLTLDWLYLGDISKLPYDVAKAIQKRQSKLGDV